MRIITLEEHFATPGFLDGPGQDLKNAALKFEGRATRLIEGLTDIADKRIAAMDAAGIDMQVLSLTSPGTEQLDAADAIALSREVNDFLAAGVKKNPKRFAGFATLPTAAPDKAAAELESRMKSGGFVGAVINGHNRGRYLDDKFFWPILEAAEALNAPIHIHPTRPPQPVVDAYYSGFSPLLDDMFASPGWGWHIETAVHVIRVVLGGTFDRFPKLQLVIGHLGEGPDVDVPAARQHDPGDDQTEKAGHLLSARERALHLLAASISRRRSSIFCSKSASTASCSRPIIPISRWRRPWPFCSKSRYRPPTASASPTATRRSCSGCES